MPVSSCNSVLHVPPIRLPLVANAALVPPAKQGKSDADPGALDLTGTTTDAGAIVDTANNVDQKSGAPSDASPNQAPTDTVVTAVDGQLTSAGSSNSTRRRDSVAARRVVRAARSTLSPMAKRLPDGYEEVFSGTGTGPKDRDASIQGVAYLTYSLVPNNTYSIEPCLDFCTKTDGCGE